jgi:hypothetical protein
VSRVEVVDHSPSVFKQPEADAEIDIWGSHNPQNFTG